MSTDLNFYMIFLVIFTLWVSSKLWKQNKDTRFQNRVIDRLEHIEKKLGNDKQIEIGLINKKISEDLKRIKERRR